MRQRPPARLHATPPRILRQCTRFLHGLFCAACSHQLASAFYRSVFFLPIVARSQSCTSIEHFRRCHFLVSAVVFTSCCYGSLSAAASTSRVSVGVIRRCSAMPALRNDACCSSPRAAGFAARRVAFSAHRSVAWTHPHVRGAARVRIGRLSRDGSFLSAKRRRRASCCIIA